LPIRSKTCSLQSENRLVGRICLIIELLQQKSVYCFCFQLLYILEVSLPLVSTSVLQKRRHEIALVFRIRIREIVDLHQLLLYLSSLFALLSIKYSGSVDLNKCEISTSKYTNTLSPGHLISKFLKRTFTRNNLKASSMISSFVKDWKPTLPGPSSFVLIGMSGNPQAMRYLLT